MTMKYKETPQFRAELIKWHSRQLKAKRCVCADHHITRNAILRSKKK